MGRNVMTTRIGSARIGATFTAELRRAPACTAQFRIARRTSAAWTLGIPRNPAGDGATCVFAHFSNAYVENAFTLTLLDSRRLRLVGLNRGVRVQATLTRQK